MKDGFCTSGTSPTSDQDQADFTLTVDAGSIFLLVPRSESAHDWVEQNIERGNGFQPWWPTVVVEHRYIANIVRGIQNDGLVVR